MGVNRQPIRASYLDYVTGYQPIRDKYFLNLFSPQVDGGSPTGRLAHDQGARWSRRESWMVARKAMLAVGYTTPRSVVMELLSHAGSCTVRERKLRQDRGEN